MTTNIFLTADLHLDHENIIKYCNRPYKNKEEMYENIINNWNEIVNSQDIVYIIGDFSLRGPKHKMWFEETLKLLNGSKILIYGNHDRLKPKQVIEVGFKEVYKSLMLDKYFLVHDPRKARTVPSSIKTMCGHVHDLFTLNENTHRVLNIGVDVWNYYPVELSVATNFLENKQPDSNLDFFLLDKEMEKKV